MTARSWTLLFAVVLALPPCALPHVIPDDVAVQMFTKPSGDRLHLIVRVPFNALADIIFPAREGGELDLEATEPLVANAAKTWISEWIDVWENGSLLARPQVAETRVSLASDESFASYQQAWAHVTGAKLPASVRIFPDQALLDVLLDYPIRSEASSFAIHSRLSRLGGRVATTLWAVLPDGAVRAYRYQGDPGVFALNPSKLQDIGRFLPLGFFELVRGSDYLLFFVCAALLYRGFRALLPFMLAFVAAHSITLIASAYNLAPEALWFPVLFETLIALSIVYLGLENILLGTPARYRWITAAAFGLVYGFGFSIALREKLQFGGTHVLASVLAFNVGIEAGLVLALALLIPLLNLIFRLGVPERIGTIFVAALAAHTGWHRMLDRAKWLRTVQWPAVDVSGLVGLLVISLIAAGLAYLAYRISPRVRWSRP